MSSINADGSMEIRGGFDDVFPGKKKVMCWAHAAKNKRLALDKYADIHKLLLAQTDILLFGNSINRVNQTVLYVYRSRHYLHTISSFRHLNGVKL